MNVEGSQGLLVYYNSSNTCIVHLHHHHHQVYVHSKILKPVRWRALLHIYQNIKLPVCAFNMSC